MLPFACVCVCICLRFDVDRMRIQYGFVIPCISHHLKIAMQYTLCVCTWRACACAYAHRFYFRISIWFLFAYYNILPVHSFICIAIYISIRSFIHTLFAFALLRSLLFPFVQHVCVPQLLPHFCALDRQAEIHFICHTINVIIGNLQKRFSVLIAFEKLNLLLYLFFVPRFSLCPRARFIACLEYGAWFSFILVCVCLFAVYLLLLLSGMQAKSHETHFTSENE